MPTSTQEQSQKDVWSFLAHKTLFKNKIVYTISCAAISQLIGHHNIHLHLYITYG